MTLLFARTDLYSKNPSICTSRICMRINYLFVCLSVNTEDCPNITFFDAESGQNLDVDISLAHPWSQGILNDPAGRMGLLPAQEKRRRPISIQEKFYQEGRHQSVSH